MEKTNIVDINTSSTATTFTIYGCGIYKESKKIIDKTEAMWLYVELHKWLFPEEKDSK